MPVASPDGSRYVIISSDCHAGADLRDYKPYLERRWHDEFDAWAASYFDPWADIDAESEWKAGVSSFMSPLNWDSNKRLEALETEGIVAEVMFPNTVPPFFPNGLLAAPGPRTADEYDRRWAGIKAHNRWLKDFCDDAPGRRFGVAQVLIDNVDDTVAEIRWAKDAGLRQVLLPSDHHLKLHNLYYGSLEPIWSVCEELDMPIGRHGSVVGSDAEPDSIDAAHAVGVLETLYFGQRSLSQLILSGVFERHPDLKFVFTELGAGTWYVNMMAALDGFCTGARADGTIINMFAGNAVAKLSLQPSEYCARQVYLGACVTPEVLEIHRGIGLHGLMWAPTSRITRARRRIPGKHSAARCRRARRTRFASSSPATPRISTAPTSSSSKAWPMSSVPRSKRSQRRCNPTRSPRTRTSASSSAPVA